MDNPVVTDFSKKFVIEFTLFAMAFIIILQAFRNSRARSTKKRIGTHALINDPSNVPDSRARATKTRIETIGHGENMKIIIKNVFVLILKKIL